MFSVYDFKLYLLETYINMFQFLFNFKIISDKTKEYETFTSDFNHISV
jgi:hypothetical protein